MEETVNKPLDYSDKIFLVFLFIFCAGLICLPIYVANLETPVPNIEIASMHFTVSNITQTRLSANWDLLIRIPSNLPDNYICLQGDLQASLFYKNITLVTSSGQRLHYLFNL